MTVTAHPGLPEFDYIKPSTIEEASQFLSGHPQEARLLLGGTDILVRMRDGVWKDKYLVDVKGIPGMMDLAFDSNQGLTIGAAINMNRVIASPYVKDHYPLLGDAARSVASYQLRTRATIVGNICNASPAGDTIGACLVYKSSLIVQSIEGKREEPLETFFLGPGRTVLCPGDIVTAIRFPNPHAMAVGKYFKLGRNKLSDLSIVGVTVLGNPDSTTPSGYRFRVALASVAPVPLLVPSVEKFLAENTVSPKTLEEAAVLAMDACNPIDDVRGSAHYRKLMVRNMTRKALVTVWEQIRA